MQGGLSKLYELPGYRPDRILYDCVLSMQRLQNKFSASTPGSIRLQAYKTLGLVPKPLLESMLDKHLPATVPPHSPVSFYKAASTSSSSAGSSSKN